MEDRAGDREPGFDVIWVADAATVAKALDPFAEERPMHDHTSDVSDAFLAGVRTLCRNLECRPLDALGCWMSESGVRAGAQNREALAAGFFQAMPATLRGLGFTGDPGYREPAGAFAAARAAGDKVGMRTLDAALSAAFLRIGLEGQLLVAARYYAPHAGLLVDAGACYAANFVPAWIGHAAEPEWVICSKDGRNDAHALRPEQSREWYRQNATLDVDEDGAVTMGDLQRAIERATQGPRWEELRARVEALEEPAPDTLPAPLAVEPALDVELSGTPTIPDEKA